MLLGRADMAGVIPFRRTVNPLAFSPGTPPFDRTNPAHVQAWNSMCELGRSELRARERVEREGC